MSAVSPERPSERSAGPASWQRYRLFAEAGRDGAYETDADGVIRWASESVREVLGWAPDQLVGMSSRDLVHPLDLARMDALRADLHEAGRRHESTTCMVRTASGAYRSLTMWARPLTDEAGQVTGVSVTVKDTHDTDAALRALATLSRANRALIQATDEIDLLDRMCRTLIDTGRYALAWYGRPVDDPAQSVAVIASAGEVSYLDQITVSWGDTPTGHGPTGRCLRTGETQVQNRFAEDPEYQPWTAAATRHGFGCSISLPVRVDGSIDGALMVYADEPAAFDALAQELLEDLAADLGYGIERLRGIDALRATTAREAEQHARLQGIFDSTIDPLVLMEGVRDESGELVDLRYLEVNAAAIAYNQLTREQMVGARLLDLFPGQLEHGPLRQYFRTIETGEPTILDDYSYGHEVLAEERRYDIRAARYGDGIALTWRDVTDRHRAAQALAESERRYRLLAENASDVIMLSEDGRSFSWVSDSSTATLGWAPEQLVGMPAVDFIHPDDAAGLFAAIQASEATGAIARFRSRWRRGDGSYCWVESAGRPIVDESGERHGRVIAIHLIDDQVRAEQALADREQRYRLLAENASDVVWQIAPDGTLAWTSPSVTRLLGWRPEDLVGRIAMELIHPEDRPRATRDREHVLQGEPYQGEYRVLHPDGTATWAALSVHPVPTPEGPVRIVAIRDVNEEVLTRERMEFLLEHDPLTGLPTRAGITRRLADLLEQADSGRRSAALYIGMDSLAEVNEALGHSAGDLLLATTAARLAGVVGEEWVGRGAGDEFIVLLAALESGADAAQLAERLRSAIHRACDVAGHQVVPTASIGIAVSSRGATAESIVRDAALAMRTAKEGGRNRYAFVDPSMAVEAEHRLAMETAIREGLEAGEFVPWLQPIVGLGSGEVVGYEALARWVRSTGTVEPGEFIPVAARSGLITDLDLALLDPTVAAIATLPAPTFVSLNVTGQTLATTDYADRVAAALRRHGVDARRLHLEITETMLLTLSDRVVAQMRALADLGCRWYVDDFGTGYSSISHLRDLPVAGLKLDMSFTRGIGEGDETSRQLAMALVGLANGLGLDTVAEGVETDAEAAFLRTLGWRHGQGWLYGKAAALP